MGCLLTFPKIDVNIDKISDEIQYISKVDFYFQEISDEDIESRLYFYGD
jgi:hypothetical protein